MLTAQVINNRYHQISRIGSGAMGAVFQTRDRLLGRDVALKYVVATEEMDLFEETEPTDYRLALVQEFKILSSLRHPNIISVLDYGFDNYHQPFFTMDFLSESKNILQAAQNRSLEEKLDLLIQLLQALAYLHRRNIIHRDLKPDNVLVKDNQVKVLDFGLAVAREHISEEFGGTVSYAAPETLSGSPPSRASDLYSAGVIAYEILAGRYPFDRANIAFLLAKILKEAPEIERLPLPQELQRMLATLLAKKPEERYPSAETVINVCAAVLGQPSVVETAAVRESFLQAASFVGRTEELQSLRIALDQANSGYGSAWLIGGESGVGKSRLLDELRTHALVSGALVLQGQAIAEGGAPYQLWRSVLRRLVLEANLADREAGFLKALIPDIDALLDREIPNPPLVDPQAARNRLINTVETLFTEINTPVVLLLEDIHWSTESLAILQRLLLQTGQLPLLVIATYRDDERPSLPEELPQMKVIRLERFADETITELSVSMLGSGGSRPQLIQLLERETEGNVFFIVEVLRELAQAAGNLAEISQMTLPKSVFAGGVQNILQRRLTHVPADYRPLLNLAALAGRELDLTVLQGMAAGLEANGFNIDAWLENCASVAVLEVKNNAWRFAHDKLRESVLGSIDKDTLPQHHRRVAEATEKAYSGHPEKATTLAYHWAEAGDKAKAAHYSEAAGEFALQNGAYHEAITHLKQSLSLHQEIGAPAEKLALLSQGLSIAHRDSGQVEACMEYANQALELLDWRLPESSGAMARSLMGQALRQLLNRVFLRDKAGSEKLATKKYHSTTAARAAEQAGIVTFFNNDQIGTLYYTVIGLNFAERAGPEAREDMARLYANHAIVAGIINLHGLARTYVRLAENLASSIDNPVSTALIQQAIATYKFSQADWEPVLKGLSDTLEITQKAGDKRNFEIAALTKALTLYLLGQWTESKALCEAYHESAEERNDRQTQAWGLAGLAAVHLRQGQPMIAQVHARQSIELLLNIKDTVGHIMIHGLLSQIYLRQANPEQAAHHAQEGLALMKANAPTLFTPYEGYCGVAEYYLWAWDHNPKEENRQPAADALKQLGQYGRLFHSGRPRLAVYRSWFNHLDGKNAGAQKEGHKALGLALEHQMPYDQALAHLHLSRTYPGGDEHKQDHLNQAKAILDELGGDFEKELLLIS